MIHGEIKDGDKINLISLKQAKELFGDSKWVDMIQEKIGWGKSVKVTSDGNDMYNIVGTPFKFNNVCFNTVSASRYSRLAGVYAKKEA